MWRIGCLLSWLHVWLGAVACCHCSASQEYHTAYCYLKRSKFKVQSKVSTEYVLLSYHHKLGTVCRLSCSSLRPTSTLWKYFKVKSNIELKFFWGEGRVKGDYVCLYITQLPQKLFFVNFFFLSVPHSPAVVPVSFLSLLKMFFSCQLF